MFQCPKCKRQISSTDVICKCGHFVLRLTLQPKQRQVLDLVRAKGKDVPTKIGFGGSRGAAKSRLARDLAIFIAFSVPGIVVFIIRRNWGDLEENHLEKLKLERPELTKYYSAGRQSYEFPQEMGGSRIAFKYGDTFDDIRRVGRGPEAYLMILDQCEQFSELELAELNTPNRWPAAGPGAAKTVYLFNPGGSGTDYLRRVFYLKQYKNTEKPGDFTFVQAYGFDNFEWFRNEEIVVDGEPLTFNKFYSLPGEIPPCPAGVYDDAWLQGVSDRHRFKMFVTQTSEGRKMWSKPEAIRMGDLFGRFDQFAGQYFAGVWDERLCVIKSSTVDALAKNWWNIWLGGDWGFGHHAAIYWACTGKISPSEAWTHLAIDTEWPIDIVIIYREFVAHRMPEYDLARAVVRMTPEPERAELQKWVMGSDVFMTDRKSPHTISQLIEAVTVPMGLPKLQRAQDKTGSRVINARNMHAMLQRTCSMRSENPPKNRPEEKLAPLLLISVECPQLIESIPLLITDEKKPDDVLKLETKSDDCFDGAKYTVAEYLSVRDQAPRNVRREEALSSVHGNTAKYMKMIEFDHEEQQSERRPRKR